MPAPRCRIDRSSDGCPEPVIDDRLLQRLVDAACAAEAVDAAHIGIHIVGDTESARLHAIHFDDPAPTDVMSFPDGSHDPASGRRLLGDIAVCWPIAQRQAAAHHHTPEDELLLYIIHGLLHLLGYDDRDPGDRQDMWQRQKTLLAAEGMPCNE